MCLHLHSLHRGKKIQRDSLPENLPLTKTSEKKSVKFKFVDRESDGVDPLADVPNKNESDAYTHEEELSLEYDIEKQVHILEHACNTTCAKGVRFYYHKRYC